MSERPPPRKPLIPAFDPNALDLHGAASELDGGFDPTAYARIVEEGSLCSEGGRPPTFLQGLPVPTSLAETRPPPSARRAAARSTIDRTSVVRLRAPQLVRAPHSVTPRASVVLSHIDGVCDAETIARRSGLPPEDAVERLRALVRLGIVEVVG